MTTSTRLADAERAVRALESVQCGEPFAAQSTAVDEALRAVRAEATARLSPGIEPVGSDLIADLAFYSDSFQLASFMLDAAALHQRCVTTHPRLARLLRSAVFMERIANTQPPGHPEDAPIHVLTDYIQRCALACSGIKEYEPWATILGVTVPALEARARTAVAKLEQHAADEIARINRDRLAAQSASMRAEDHRRQELAAFFTGRQGLRFIVMGDRVVSGGALAAAARRTMALDDAGEQVRLSLQDLETIYQHASAAANVA